MSEFLYWEKQKKTDFVVLQANPKRPPLSQEKELELRKELSDERRRIASERAWSPAYIFQNKTIDSLVAILPETKEELLGVWGLSHTRVEEFGEEILLIIEKYLDEEIKES